MCRHSLDEEAIFGIEYSIIFLWLFYRNPTGRPFRYNYVVAWLMGLSINDLFGNKWKRKFSKRGGGGVGWSSKHEKRQKQPSRVKKKSLTALQKFPAPPRGGNTREPLKTGENFRCKKRRDKIVNFDVNDNCKRYLSS